MVQGEPALRLRKVSLSSAPFYASITVILSLMLFIGIFWLYNEHRAYQESIENIRENYATRYKDRLREEAANITDFIEYKRSRADMIIEGEIRQKVQTAYSIAAHIYSMYKDKKSVDDLRGMVVEILRPIRWNTGRGSYFAGRVRDRVIDLYADDPSFEGTRRLFQENAPGKNLVDEFIRIVRDKEAGVYRYTWSKRDQPRKSYPKIAFVKYFKPFDWYIGAGMSIDDREEKIRNDVLTRVQRMRFGSHGTVFVFRFDGTILCDTDERLVGRSVGDLISTSGMPYGRQLLRVGLNGDDGGYVSHTEKEGPNHKVSHLFDFVQPYTNWQWVIGTSMNMDEMERAIERETQAYRKIAFKNIFLFIGLFAFSVTLLLAAAYSFSLKIRNEISLFTEFFRKAADSKLKIDNVELVFCEFEELARLANRMVDDMVRTDLLLHRDELRLDTLLHLGRMAGRPIQDIYDFTLQRIVRITRSEEGYMALVNDAQTHLAICSYCRTWQDDVDFRGSHTSFTRRLEDGGFPGLAALRQADLLVNDPEETDSTFPYERTVKRHIDVPICNGGKTVVVAGVCTTAMPYDTTDVRQVRMVLEGMWLHVSKACSEKELTRLERQVIAISQEERSQIGRDLHDDLGSHLSGVEMLSKVLQKQLEGEAPDKASQLGVIRDLIRSAIEKTRRLSQGLYPVHLIEHGLEVSIEEMAVEVENLFHVRCTLSFDSSVGLMDNNVATHIYFIVREAVFNAARHGKPGRIDITFTRTDGFLKVEIADDGCGVGDMLNKKKGMGFHTMKYRAKAMGASLDIRSGIEGGTVVTLAGEVLR